MRGRIRPVRPEAPVIAAHRTRLRDLLELGKPRLSSLVLFTAGLGVWMAPGAPGAGRVALFLAGTVGLVFGANSLNCVIEREVDARMHRTRARPLPTGRVTPRTAAVWGAFLAAASLTAIRLGSNWTATALGAIAFVVYIAIYTPLKRRSATALYVGAIPGAIPPLMGWSAGGGGLSAGGWALFALLFFWQLPHFLAIALYLKEDYARGGLQVFSIVYGEAAARRHLVGTSALLAVAGVAPALAGLGGRLYAIFAAALGIAFVMLAASGMRGSGGAAWARHVFLYSLLYLPALAAGMVISHALGDV